MSNFERLSGEATILRVIEDAALKRERVRVWLTKKGLDGVVITRRDNFAWLTGGGDNRVIESTEIGVGSAVITPQEQFLVAHSMDADRLIEEQVSGQGYELVLMRWHEGDPRERARDLAGQRVGADTLIPGTEYIQPDLLDLHYPLTDLEMNRCHWLGQRVSEILETLATQVKPGMTEREVAIQLHIEHIRHGIDLDVLIVGSDERIFRYRHPLPTDKPIERYLLLHPVARRWGLHGNVTRSIHFGQPTLEIKRAYRAAATVEAFVIASLQPGLRFADILAHQKAWYAQLGFPDEWHFHYQGGPTGYIIVDATRCLTDKQVQLNQAFDWFITVTGAKVEELTLLTSNGPKIVSLGSHWPRLEIQTDQGVFFVPDLMIR